MSHILRVWSLLAETIQAPSGLTAQAVHLVGVACEGGFGAGGSVPNLESVILTGGDDPGAVRAHRTSVHLVGVAGEGASSAPVAASQILRVLSELAETIQVPSGLIAQPFTQPVWPVRVDRSVPVATSQILRDRPR